MKCLALGYLIFAVANVLIVCKQLNRTPTRPKYILESIPEDKELPHRDIFSYPPPPSTIKPPTFTSQRKGLLRSKRTIGYILGGTLLVGGAAGVAVAASHLANAPSNTGSIPNNSTLSEKAPTPAVVPSFNTALIFPFAPPLSIPSTPPLSTSFIPTVTPPLNTAPISSYVISPSLPTPIPKTQLNTYAP